MKTPKSHSEIIYLTFSKLKNELLRIATKSQVVTTFNVTKSRLLLGLNAVPEIQLLYDLQVTILEANQAGNQRPLAERDKYLSMQKIKEIQGNLVLLPLNYLSEVNLLPSVFAKEGLVPTVTWT